MRCFLGMLCLVFALAASAQNRKEDVIYLKNGSVIRGKLLEQSASTIRIQINGGSVLAYAAGEVAELKQEPALHVYNPKPKGFAHYTELGALASGNTTTQGVTNAAFSFQTVNGYRFHPAFMMGVGTGVDLYASQTLIPVFASVRGDLISAGAVIPFYYLDAGQSINITRDSNVGEEFKGGLLFGVGLGVKVPFNKSAGFLLSLGYRQQTTVSQFGMSEVETKYRRLAIRAGFFL